MSAAIMDLWLRIASGSDVNRGTAVPRVITPSRSVTEKVRRTFDFTGQLKFGETISSAAMSVTTFSGDDDGPTGILDGSPTIDGAVVTQYDSGGTDGCIYFMTCSATTSLGAVFELGTYIAVAGS